MGRQLNVERPVKNLHLKSYILAFFTPPAEDKKVHWTNIKEKGHLQMFTPYQALKTDIQPIALLERDTNFQDLKGANRSVDTNPHMHSPAPDRTSLR